MELSWRLFYLFLSFVFCSLCCIYYGEFILAFCLEPWYNEWEMDTMQYVNPQEIWSAYRKISFLFSFILIYPFIWLQIAVYTFNSRTRGELKSLFFYTIFSNISFYFTWFILVDCSIIGALMDLSHFDEDTEIIYVPNLSTYIDSWFSFMLSGLIVRQLPLFWFYRNSIRSNQIKFSNELGTKPERASIISFNKPETLENRIWFIIVFRLPGLIRAILLFDDIRLQIIWLIILRLFYLIFLFAHNIRDNY